MAKFINDTILDQALNYLKNNGETMVLCEGQPSTYTNATTLKSGAGNKLGDVSMSTGDYTLADGDASGRKVTVTQKGILVDESGTADHVAIVDDTNTTLLLVTTITSTSVTNGETRTVEAFDEEILDAS